MGFLEGLSGVEVFLGRSRDRAFTLFCWFPAFSCRAPLARDVSGLACILKVYGYIDLAGSESK